MNIFSEWLNLGGYGQYVWPAYALTLVVVWLNIRWARQSVRDARTTARRRIAMLRGVDSDS
jgi:heme exporter protein CcmD